MTNDPDSKPRETLSRREFVKGRFFRGLRKDRDASRTARSNAPANPDLGSLVMRYPKNQQEVETGIPLNSSAVDSSAVDSQGPSSESAQRRAVAMFLMETPPAADAGPDTRHRTIPLLRPPGAIDEASFLQRCTKCGDCAKACPHQAIKWAGPQLRSAEGTPMIVPEEQPCLMCSDFPCIQACPEEALTRRVPPMMGTARITEHLCLAYHGTTCSVCSERCPVAGAITWQQVATGLGTSSRPVVTESICTGCGVCRFVCPAPENAILLMPTFHRPSLPPRGTSV